MSDQREIHIDTERLREFLLGDDRETRRHALKGAYEIFDVHTSNGPQVQAKIIVVLNAKLPEFKDYLLTSDVTEKRILVGMISRMVDCAGADALDVSTQALEIALETNNFNLRREAQNLVIKYMDTGVNRRGIMRALVGEAALNLSWENVGVFRNIATSSLGYPELRETALVVLANVAAHPGAQVKERESALITIETLLLKGADISCIEKELKALAKQRNCPFLDNAKILLSEANMRGFNKPGKPGIFARLGVAINTVAPVPLRRTGTV